MFPRANPRPWAGALLTCGLLALVAGCGPDYKARGTVKGRVKVGDRPLPFGTVMFVNKDGISATANVDENGNYEMKDAPVGECQVTVTVNALPMDAGVRARMKGKGAVALPEGPRDPNAPASPELPTSPRVPKEVIPIDEKYSKPNESGLKFTVKKGDNTYDINL